MKGIAKPVLMKATNLMRNAALFWKLKGIFYPVLMRKSPCPIATTCRTFGKYGSDDE
jgi:hypothetical protein